MSKSYICAVHDKDHTRSKQSVKVINSVTEVENNTFIELFFFTKTPLNYSACMRTLHLRSGSCRVVVIEKKFDAKQV